ncbi:MAG: polyribonucleotide nucleotidyltransferase [Anaerolineales bacterium]|nr:polyribonucleotide nucleotidyltransferase [Anaerolineales bacterium]
MNQIKTYTTEIGGKTITLETGKYAEQAGGAVTIRVADTLMLATATMSKTPREGIDFFPLTVDYEERLYAGGRIPGSFFRREGRPSEAAILIARLTDRPIRPLFPKDMRNDVQVIMYAFSSDGEIQMDMLAINAASAALTISDIPFDGPIAAVRIGKIDGEFIVDPTYLEMEQSSLDLRIAGTRDAILMVEAGADEVDEDTMVEAIRFAHEAMQPLIDLQLQMKAEVGKEKRSYISFSAPDGIEEAVKTWLGDRIEKFLSVSHQKVELYAGFDALEEELVNAFEESGEYESRDVSHMFHDLLRTAVRRMVLSEGRRLDGRGLSDIRPLSAEVELSPRAHGSGLFSRGATQVLTIATLGTPRERQELDGLSPVDEKRYMHQYNFPPFSVGETRPLRGTSRREVGHGNLAERALLPVLPAQEEFAYTLRLVSECLSSNGSTSMASVCASTLALMDTGVPIKAPVAGIAMGLIKEGEEYSVLTDILGTEDHLGDMDFKVAGTRKGITALQMDIKIRGITPEIMREALTQALDARLRIMAVIEECMPAPRPELKSHAPRMVMISIDPEKIGAIIGPGGKTIRSIQDDTGASIDIQDDGSVFISAVDGIAASEAQHRIEGLIEEPVVGRIYTGRVVRTTDFGAFVEILPNTDGLVHISQLASEMIDKVEDVARVGDELTVMITAIDHAGKVRLSRQAVLEGWTLEEAIAKDRKPSGKRSSSSRGPSRRSGGSSNSRRNN